MKTFYDELKFDVKYLWLRRLIYLTWSVFYIIIAICVAMPIGVLGGLKNGFVQMANELRAGWINL